MNLYKTLSILIACLGLLSACTQETSQNLYENQQNIIQTTSGETINLAANKGKWLLINFWASWCAPCRAEIPALSEFYQAHTDKVAIIGASIDPQDHEKMDKLIEQFNITYPVTTQNLQPLLQITPQFLPLTVVINPQGRVVTSEVKVQTKESLEKLIAS